MLYKTRTVLEPALAALVTGLRRGIHTSAKEFLQSSRIQQNDVTGLIGFALMGC